MRGRFTILNDIEYPPVGSATVLETHDIHGGRGCSGVAPVAIVKSYICYPVVVKVVRVSEMFRVGVLVYFCSRYCVFELYNTRIRAYVERRRPAARTNEIPHRKRESTANMVSSEHAQRGVKARQEQQEESFNTIRPKSLNKHQQRLIH